MDNLGGSCAFRTIGPLADRNGVILPGVVVRVDDVGEVDASSSLEALRRLIVEGIGGKDSGAGAFFAAAAREMLDALRCATLQSASSSLLLLSASLSLLVATGFASLDPALWAFGRPG